MMRGMVFDVQHFCVDDGPGIRSTVFFKGCPLRCVWCHNAEGLHRERQLFFVADPCTLCGACEAVCPNGVHIFEDGRHCLMRSKCTACGKCAEVCPSNALRVVGKEMTVEEILEDVLRCQPFFDNSGGGITLSGGEPLMQGDFACELAQSSKLHGMHVCVETCGYCSGDVIRKIAAHTDLFLYDIKHIDPEAHKQLTGVDNRLILENLELLARLNKPVVLRCPIIPDCNDGEAHALAVAELANRMDNITEIHIEPYHPFGVEKYTALGMKLSYGSRKMMDSAVAEQIAEQIRMHTKKEVILT